MNRQKSEIEIYNDLDGELVNLFYIVRDPGDFGAFKQRLLSTPYSRLEYESSLDFAECDDRVERACRFYTVLNQSVSGKRLAGRGDWSRNRTNNNAETWFNKIDGLGLIHERIRSVQLECRDALSVIKDFDSPDTTFYLDPPYILEARGSNKYYAVEPGDDFHRELLEIITGAKGAVVLSGYDHPIYDALTAAGWRTDTYSEATTMDIEHESMAGRSLKRVEVVWRNERAAEYSMMRPLW